MDEEYKKEKELNKKRGSTLSPNNIIKKKAQNQEKIMVKKIRKLTYQIENEEISGPRSNINPIKVNSRKQSVA